MIVKECHPSALDPLGEALYAYWRGDKSSHIIQEYKTGQKKTIPASVFFRSVEDFYPTEQVFNFCRGRILVVGAGTGVHALELEHRGYDVTAIEINPLAVKIMKERGVSDVRLCDFFQYSGELYDSILMLGHNIGICETVSRLKNLLQKCKSLLVPSGQLIVNSVNETGADDANEARNYPGEQEFRLSHQGTSGPWMRWLHVDFETLNAQAIKCGWSTEGLIDTEDGFFLARLKPYRPV